MAQILDILQEVVQEKLCKLLDILSSFHTWHTCLLMINEGLLKPERNVEDQYQYSPPLEEQIDVQSATQKLWIPLFTSDARVAHHR